MATNPPYPPFPPYPPYAPYAPYPPYPPYPAYGCCCPCTCTCVGEGAVAEVAVAETGVPGPELPAPVEPEPSAAPEPIEPVSSSSAAVTPESSASSESSSVAFSSSSSSTAGQPSALGSSSSSAVAVSSSAASSAQSSSSNVVPSSSSSSLSSAASFAPPPQTGEFAVSNVVLPAVEGHHKGTGSHTVQKLVVKPDSLVDWNTNTPLDAALEFETITVHITTLLYRLNPPAVPNWFGVAVPDGITDFTRPIIYFHPNPAGIYVDQRFGRPPNETYLGMMNPEEPGISDVERDNRRDWWNLFEYVDRLGHQLAGAVHYGASPDQVLILPFLASSIIGTCGILPKHWHPIVNDILADVRQRVTGVTGPLTVTNVVVAGFSYGHTIASNFRKLASARSPNVLGPVMKQVWAFDGAPNQDDLASVAGQFRAIKYDQHATANTSLTNVHLSSARWSQYPPNLPEEEPGLFPASDRHHNIRDYMFLDAAMKREIAP